MTAENWQHVPSLNSVRMLESLPPRTLVRLKCMVADVMEPEFYSAEFAIANASGEQRGVRVLYEDQLQLPEGCVEVGGIQQSSLLQRVSLMCTPVPGEPSVPDASMSHVTNNALMANVFMSRIIVFDTSAQVRLLGLSSNMRLLICILQSQRLQLQRANEATRATTKNIPMVMQ